MAKLYAIADLHIGYGINGDEWKKLEPHPPGSGLILAGDMGETAAHLTTAFTKAKACFEHVFWVPGNHELYSMIAAPLSAEHEANALRGEEKYMALVELARGHGVLTPEDPWMIWEGPDGEQTIIALCFALYDYSFRPADVTRERALAWALEKDIQATDEALLHADPYKTRDEWCHTLCDKWEARFRDYSTAHPDVPFVIVNHWPLREDLVYIPRIPRFSLWCGTKRTEDWHRKGRFGDSYAGAQVVVTGHLHVRRTDRIEGCRFEEASLGYPPQWADARTHGKDVNQMLRRILPNFGNTDTSGQQTTWRRYG
ncbi:MAG: hypothetical protein MMC23_009588 [Stictis urceolatum]|nr:hypothetical protein [Stictis urceolata]